MSSPANSIGSWIATALEGLRRRASGEEKPILTPWPSLDDALGGGLWPGSNVLVGGTGMAKTQLAVQAAVEAATAGVPVAYLALEHTRPEMAARLLGLAAGRRWSDLYCGRLHPKELDDLVAQYATPLSALPLSISFADAYAGGDDIVERADSMRHQHPSGPLLIVLDYLQLAGSTGDEKMELRERIARASAAARVAARTYDATVLLISSTSRANYSDLAGAGKLKLGDGHPGRLVGAAKESGEVEYSADAVMVMSVEPWPDGKPPADGSVCWLAVAKIRAGVPSWVRMRFNGCRFTDEPLHAGDAYGGGHAAPVGINTANGTDDKVPF